MTGFFTFVRQQGIMGLAIGFILGGAVNKVVSSLVGDIINPAVGSMFGGVRSLSDMTVGSVKLGSFLATLIDFLIIAAVVYFVFRGLKLDRLDMKKDA